ncbi:hypothetical protein [uncultured Shewanella sp.]|uniref:hypothetical protein n=1 Tax=uncultured Shewanella sp. TaxID=173975 RepID=UPI0026201805|nr:hypothetical protein [uncultured Shewanella sp.]
MNNKAYAKQQAFSYYICMLFGVFVLITFGIDYVFNTVQLDSIELKALLYCLILLVFFSKKFYRYIIEGAIFSRLSICVTYLLCLVTFALFSTHFQSQSSEEVFSFLYYGYLAFMAMVIALLHHYDTRHERAESEKTKMFDDDDY